MMNSEDMNKENIENENGFIFKYDLNTQFEIVSENEIKIYRCNIGKCFPDEASKPIIKITNLNHSSLKVQNLTDGKLTINVLFSTFVLINSISELNINSVRFSVGHSSRFLSDNVPVFSFEVCGNSINCKSKVAMIEVDVESGDEIQICGFIGMEFEYDDYSVIMSNREHKKIEIDNDDQDWVW